MEASSPSQQYNNKLTAHHSMLFLPTWKLHHLHNNTTTRMQDLLSAIIATAKMTGGGVG
jgi:hypothetical protein